MRMLMTQADGPVALLSNKEKAILEVIAEADRPLTVKEICERAGICERTYRNFIRRKDFRNILAPALNFLVESNLIDVTASLLRRAKGGNVKSQELLFKLLGLLKENHPSIIQIFNLGGDSGPKYLTQKEVNQLLED